MRTKRFFVLLSLSAFLMVNFSCSEDDNDDLELVSPAFTVSVSPDNSALYTFENITPNKQIAFSFWKFSEGATQVRDNPDGTVEFQYNSSGTKVVTLTMVGDNNTFQASQTIEVTVPDVEVENPTNEANLLLNAYLTEGSGDDFTNWGKYNGASRMVEETNETLIGGRAMKVVNPSDGQEYETQFVSDPVATVVGEVYTASMWVKGDPVSVRFSTKPDGTAQYQGGQTVTSDWQQISWTITANEPMTNISLDLGLNAGTFYVDVIEFVPGDTAPPLPTTTENLVLNGDLEAGSGNDFTNWGKYNGADNMTQETSDVYEGARALKVSVPADGLEYETQFVSDPVATVVGDVYTISMWIKGDGGNVRYSTKPDATAQYAGGYAVTLEWTQYSWEFTANEPLTNISLDMGLEAGNFVVDKIELTKN